MQKYIEVYEKYIAGENAKTLLDSKTTIQRIKATVTIKKDAQTIGIIAENVDTNEIFFIPQEVLNVNIQGEGYLQNAFLTKGILFVRPVIKINNTVVFPYTTILINLE